MSGADTFTRWAVVSSGQGGGRIAAEFFARAENPGIDDRIVVMNTNRADIRNTLNRPDVPDSMEEAATVFGEKRGVGNAFAEGEECARQDIDKLIGAIDTRAPDVDALLYIAALGGGTGNGSVPYLIGQFTDLTDSDQRKGWMTSARHLALGVWPYYDEAVQQQFNAVCGLSRLLRRPNGDQNADMVLLAANSHLDDDAEGRNLGAVNRRITGAIDLLIGAGRETDMVIDVEDLVAQPSQIWSYHFTPAVDMARDYRVFDLEYAFDKAAEKTFVPMDVSTADAAYAVVRAPEGLIEDEESPESGRRGGTNEDEESRGLTEADVQAAFSDWKVEQGIGDAVGMSTLTPKAERGSDVDVLLLLGGFDLNPLLDRSWDGFERHKERLAKGQEMGNASLSADRLRTIEENLVEYVRYQEE